MTSMKTKANSSDGGRRRGRSKAAQERQEAIPSGNNVFVQFLGDADTLETIQSISKAAPTRSLGLTLAQKRVVPAAASARDHTIRRRLVAADFSAGESDLDSDGEPAGASEALRQLNSAQLEEHGGGDAVRGSAVFGFQRRQRRQHFRKVAEEYAAASETAGTRSEEPSTPKRGPAADRSVSRGRGRGRRTPATPTAGRGGGGRSVAVTPRTPQTPGRTPTRRAASPPAKTPQTVRRRIKQRLAKLQQEEIAVSDDDSDFSPLEESSDSSEEDEPEAAGDRESGSDEDKDAEEEEEPRQRSEATVAPPARRGTARRRSEPAELAADAEQYFALHSARGVTSNHTLSRLAEPRLSHAALQTLLGGRPADHAAERAALLDDVELLFPHWLVALGHGFNVLLHGLGSKRAVLERLRLTQLQHRLHVVVNGFHPSVTPRQLLQTLLEDVLEVAAPPGRPEAQAEAVLRRFSGSGDARLFLLVNSMDGPMMRGERMQQLLARLAQAPRVHLVASVDHINAPLIWDQHKLAQFNFLWFDATTLLPYTEETSYENSLLVRQTADLALSSLRHVFKSLTPNARGIFILLAKHQLENADDRTFEGLPLSELYRRCREQFLVSSQVALRAQLTEFRDHKLIRSRATHDGVEQLTVPLEAPLIAEFLAGCDDS
ncbi:origin recognition complex subunit 2-like [Pollicipes pollicipes]|uniref:origin recognition complex subunit 2-like n=1 Tax=Pollicipes pollicipes TaxID=41117 RepID=UPI001884FECF|nr:origin recognition complex subunit 2-like [Pollicipes pollicipes]